MGYLYAKSDLVREGAKSTNLVSECLYQRMCVGTSSQV